MKRAFLATAFLLAAGHLYAAIKTEVIEYKHGKTVCEGFLA